MAGPTRLLAVVSLLACACGGPAVPAAAAPASPAAPPSAAGPGGAGKPAAPGAGRAERVAGRRGDRHARAAARVRPSVKRAHGTVSRASDRLVVIRPDGAPDLALRVAPGTRVTVEGRPARAEALREGTEVRAAYRSGEGGSPTALTIEAERRR